MAVRDIVIWPDPVLKNPAQPVSPEEIESLQPLLDDMVESMYAADGLGLAAPQVGVGKRIFVVDTTSSPNDPEGRGLMFFINPEILEADGSTLFEEGCLSLPGLTVDMERHTRVRMKALDRQGKPFEVEAEGLEAIALQHELDHLEGRLLVDRLSSLKRQMTRKRLLKLKEEQAAERAAS